MRDVTWCVFCWTIVISFSVNLLYSLVLSCINSHIKPKCNHVNEFVNDNKSVQYKDKLEKRISSQHVNIKQKAEENANEVKDFGDISVETKEIKNNVNEFKKEENEKSKNENVDLNCDKIEIKIVTERVPDEDLKEIDSRDLEKVLIEHQNEREEICVEEIVLYKEIEKENINLLDLPDEVLVLILLLVNEPRSLKDFSLTCHRILAIFQDSYVKEYSIRKFFVDAQGKCKKCRIIDGHYSSCIFHPRQPDPRLFQGEIKQISSSEVCRKCKRIYYLCNCVQRDLKTCVLCRAVMGHYSFCSNHKKNKLQRK